MILMVGDEKTVLLFKGKRKTPTIDDRSLALLRGRHSSTPTFPIYASSITTRN